jgi:hypothetical protein
MILDVKTVLLKINEFSSSFIFATLFLAVAYYSKNISSSIDEDSRSVWETFEMIGNFVLSALIMITAAQGNEQVRIYRIFLYDGCVPKRSHSSYFATLFTHFLFSAVVMYM